jgi:hypothetical protein
LCGTIDRVLKDWNPDGKAQKLARSHPQAHAQEESQKLEAKARLLKKTHPSLFSFLCSTVIVAPLSALNDHWFI